MSKQYNLSTTEDNGQSVTTSQTVTEHPEEILRLMKLAGLENAQVVAEDDSVFEPTPANDKLDLDDYSKKSPESIAKQKKTIQPTLGDNPLEYSLDENEIYEAMMEEFDKSEEVNEDNTRLQRAIQTNFGENGEGDSDYDAYWPDYMNNKDVIVAIFGSNVPKTIFDAFNKHKAYSKNDEDRAKNKKIPSERNNHAPYYPENRDEEILADLGERVRDTIVLYAEDIGIETLEEVNEELTAGQKKLPAGLQKAILAKQGKKDEAVEETDEESTEEVVVEDFEVDPDSVGYDDHIKRLARKRGNMSTKDMIDAGIPVHQQKVVHVSTDDDDSSNNPYKDEKGPVKMRKAVLTNDFDESKEVVTEEKLTEGCSCGCSSGCNCGPECGCGCNAVNEDQDRMAKLAGLNERGATRPMNFAGTKDHRIKGDTSKSGPEVDTLKHVDKIQKLAWNKAKAKPSHHDSSSKQAKIDIIMPKKRDTVAIKGDLTKVNPNAKSSKIDIKGDLTKVNPNAKEPKIGIKGDSSKSKLRGEDLERLKKLAGIQEDGSEMNPSRLPHPDIDPGDQSFDWPEDGPKIDIDNMEKMPKVTVKGPKNYDDRIQRLARAKDKANPKEPLSLKAYLNF